MKVLLMSPRASDDALTIADTGEALGWRVVRAADWRECEGVPRAADVALWGEAHFALWIAEREGLQLTVPAVDWLCSLPARYRKRDIRLTTLAEARRARNPVFVKDAVLARMPSAVYRPDELPPGDYPVLAADPVRWECEYRFFVLDGEPTTFGLSHRDGARHRPGERTWEPAPAEAAEAIRFIEELLGDVTVPDAVVVDVGRIAGAGWAVVEANPAWSSALYGCDPFRAFAAIARATSWSASSAG